MEHNERTNDERMYELLCKVVFGEASADEAAEIEVALAASPELRDQKSELEATVSLVQNTMGEGEDASLSPQRMESVLAAAGGGGNVITATPWSRTGGFKAAAAVVLVTGGAVMALQDGSKGMDVVGGSRMAIFEDDSLRARSEGTVDVESKAELLGFTSDRSTVPTTLEDVTNGLEDMASAGLDPNGSGTPGTNAAGSPSSGFSYDKAASASSETKNRFLSIDGATAADAEFGGQALVERTEALRPRPVHRPSPNPAPSGSTLVGGKGEALAPKGLDVFTRGLASADSASVFPADGGVALNPAPTPGGAGNPNPVGSTPTGVNPAGLSAAVGGSPPMGGTEPPASGPGAIAVSKFVTPPTTGAAATPSTDAFFLGAGEKNAAPVVADSRSADAYAYRGPGDTVPPGGTVRYEERLSKQQVDLHFRGFSAGGVVHSHGFPVDEIRHNRCAPTPLPNERPRDMFFRFWGDNPYVVSKLDALSTFAADVDTASFSLARRSLREGRAPVRAQIRTEEFVNFLKPDLPAPSGDTFAIHGELSPSPFGGREDRYLLRVGVRALEIDRDKRPPLALTFVVDTSGSMKENNRLELVKHAMRLLIAQLDGRDTISIVGFSSQAKEVLWPTPATDKNRIETALFGLQPNGSTNAEAGLLAGYRLAESSLRDGAQSRVVFLSDGVANVGQTDQNRIADDVAGYTKRGIFLNTIGVGMGNHNDVFLEQLADKGEGVCDYVGNADDARRAIVDRFTGGFVTVAKDVKIQVEFDPKVVLRWRQIGYENRAVRDNDFRNDAVDAGEIGAGHQVTCLYEVELASGDTNREMPMATARVRWIPVALGEAQPALEEAVERETALRYSEVSTPSFRGASQGFRRAALAAQLAECMRFSVHTRGDSVSELGKELAQLLSEDRHEDTAIIAEMTKQAIGLGLKAAPAPGHDSDDAAHRRTYYDSLIRSLGGVSADASAPTEAGKDRETASVSPNEYEARIRKLLDGDQSRKPH